MASFQVSGLSALQSILGIHARFKGRCSKLKDEDALAECQMQEAV